MFTYLGGYPRLKPGKYFVERDGDDVLFTAIKGFKSTVFLRLPQSSFGGGDFDKKHTRSLGKAALGAVAGGALAGPLGVIAGGVFGGRKRSANSIEIPIYDNSTEFNMRFAGSEKDYQKLLNAIFR